MACACKANKELELLHKKYGHKVSPTKRDLMGFYTIEGLKGVCASLIILMCTPLLFIYVFHKRFFAKEKRISVKKLLRKDARK